MRDTIESVLLVSQITTLTRATPTGAQAGNNNVLHEVRAKTEIQRV